MSEKYSVIMRLGHRSDAVLLRELTSDRLVVRRTAGESQAQVYRILKEVKAPHVPEVYSVVDIGNGQYEILEEYIEGCTLEELLEEDGQVSGQVGGKPAGRAEGRFDLPTASAYVTQLCEALQKLHRAGLVHRDIKPGNIIIAPSGDLYLIDFDIARIRKPGADSDTEILGTQGYAAPEQFGFHQTGAQADIYSAGVLLNKLLTGKLPNECFAKGPAAHIIRCCLQMDTARRYRSAGALKRALRPYLPKGHPQSLRFLRRIPGFRSFTGWKMALAGVYYVFFLLSVVLAIWDLSALELPVRVSAAIVYLYYLFLYFFLFDVLRIRSCIPWLERSRGRWYYPLRCILMALLLMAVSVALSMLAEYMLKKYLGA